MNIVTFIAGLNLNSAVGGGCEYVLGNWREGGAGHIRRVICPSRLKRQSAQQIAAAAPHPTAEFRFKGRPAPSIFFSALACLCLNKCIRAWHCDGHYAITASAVEIVSDSLPAFFAETKSTIVRCACAPDIFKMNELAQLDAQESPEHYFDHELYPDTLLAQTRAEYVKVCISKGVVPSTVGFLPYAVAEWTQRMTISLAEYRAYPGNTDIERACAVYAGILSHYAADLCQPLHLTVHFNGRVKNISNPSPRTGIHEKVDALTGKLELPPARLLKGAVVYGFGPALMDSIQAQMRRSIGYIDTVYKLEQNLPPMNKPLGKGSRVEKFASERFAASALFVARLYVTAWKESGRIKLPSWYAPK